MTDRDDRSGPGPRPDPGEVVTVDLAADMPASVYNVPDAMWDFDDPERDEHPGLCVFAHPHRFRVMLVSGTSRPPPDEYAWMYLRVDPTAGNGLTKPTYFKVGEPRVFKFHAVARLHFDRRRGRVDDAQLRAVRDRIAAILFYSDPPAGPDRSQGGAA